MRLEDVRGILEGFEARRRVERDDEKLAAVAVIAREVDAETELLFIHRAEHPQDPWSGHMAFPGGRVDPDDANPLAAAIRETHEELGIDLVANGELLGPLSDVTAVARGRRLGLTIVPFVFELTSDVSLRPNYEVQEALWIPLRFFVTESGNRSTMQWRYGDVDIPLPCFRFENRLIWGLTFGMLDELVGALENRR